MNEMHAQTCPLCGAVTSTVRVSDVPYLPSSAGTYVGNWPQYAPLKFDMLPRYPQTVVYSSTSIVLDSPDCTVEIDPNETQALEATIEPADDTVS